MYPQNSNPQKEKEGGIRISAELVNSQTFHNNIMVDVKFRQLLKALVNKLITYMQSSISIGSEGEDILVNNN